MRLFSHSLSHEKLRIQLSDYCNSCKKTRIVKLTNDKDSYNHMMNNIETEFILKRLILKWLNEERSKVNGHRTQNCSQGNEKVNSDPFPSSLSKKISPPCFSTNSLHNNRPSPLPFSSIVP